MFLVTTNHAQFSLAADNLAVLTNTFDAGSYFHGEPSTVTEVGTMLKCAGKVFFLGIPKNTNLLGDTVCTQTVLSAATLVAPRRCATALRK